MTTSTHRDPRRVVTAIDNRTYDTLEEAHKAAFAAVGKAYGVSWHEFGGECDQGDNRESQRQVTASLTRQRVGR